MNELFPEASASAPDQGADAGRTPLAARMRPRSLDEVFGQQHLLGNGCLLPRLVESGTLGAALFYGPPGTGKTSTAIAIAGTLGDRFITLNGVESSVADLRRAVQGADEQWRVNRQRTLALIDEIHRFNKAQQDVLLPHVERGALRLIGATTLNPFYYVNAALVSRMQVFTFEPLDHDAIIRLLKRALIDEEKGLGHLPVDASDEALAFLAERCGGDARQALNALEVGALTTPLVDGRKVFDRDAAAQSLQQKPVVYDADGDAHYDTLSAFIKCIRGSEPDAALYWLGKMLVAGEDPRIITRRLMISAAEDIGLADPPALSMAVACHQAVEAVGLPEGRIPMAEVTVYLATAPKSNAAYKALDEVMEEIRSGRVRAVPKALRDSSHSKARQRLGHGKDYQYAHAYADGLAPDWLVEGMKEYYQPTGRGYEKVVAERLERWKAKRQALRQNREGAES